MSRMRSRRRAVTLIELLIVIAMIAIMTAATFSVITVPLQEDAFSRIEASAESGLASFFSALVQDAHGAAALEALPEGNGLRLKEAGPDGADMVYTVDAGRRLRRVVVAPGGGADSGPVPGSALLENVEELVVEPVAGTPLHRIRVRGGTTKYGHPMSFDRQMTVGVGVTSFAGGGR